MTLADEHQHSPLIPSRRSVVRAAAWSVPAISVAAASPAFATSPPTPPAELVTFTSGMFWRPEPGEIADPEEAELWGLLPAGTIIWITQVTNLAATAAENVTLELAAPPIASGLFPVKGFRVLDARSGEDVLTVTPAPRFLGWDNRANDGRVLVTLPTVPSSVPTTVTVVVQKPESITRGQSPAPAWNVTVTPPGTGGTISAPITSYADFLASLEP